MSDYGTFESLGHEGHDKKIAAEKRDEALDRAAARIIEDTGDFFRNAASQDDFNQRWDMGITNVRRSAAKETETSDDTMNAIRERVAALTIDTKPKPRKRATRRKASAPAKRRTATHVTWENDGFGTDMFGNEYTISLGGAGEYDLTVNDGLTTTTVGRYPTREQAQDAARTVYARRFAGRKQSALVWVEDPMEPDEYLGSDPALGENQYAIVFNGVGWELILESLLSHHSETIGVYDSIDAAKQAADHALVSARRKRASISWVPADNMGGEALTGTSDDGTSFDLYYGDDDLYHVVAYYPDGEVGADQTYETLADAKNHTEWATRSAHRQASRRKQAWRITKNRDWSGSQLRQVSDTMYSIYPPSGADNIDGRFAVQKAIDRSRMVRRMELRYAPPWTSTNMPDDVVVGYYDTPEEAFQAVLSGEAFNKLDQIKNSNFKGAGRKQAWAMSDDGMTYTSTQVQDSFDCPTCGAGNKLGFSRCACGKQWNSYTIEGANGEHRMVAREVEARPEAVLAKRRQAARPSRAAQRKRDAEDVANGNAAPGQGVTARRKRHAGRTEESRTKSAYQAGRRAAQRNLPPNPAAPLAYLTGYRDYLRSALKRG